MKQKKPCPKVQLLWILKISSKRDCFHRIFCWKETLSSYQMNSRPTIFVRASRSKPVSRTRKLVKSRTALYDPRLFSFIAMEHRSGCHLGTFCVAIVCTMRLNIVKLLKSTLSTRNCSVLSIKAKRLRFCALGKLSKLSIFLTVSSLVLKRTSLWKASSISNVFRCLLKSNHSTQPCSHGVEFIFFFLIQPKLPTCTKATNKYVVTFKLNFTIWNIK